MANDDRLDPDAVMVPDNVGDPLSALEDDVWFDIDDIP